MPAENDCCAVSSGRWKEKVDALETLRFTSFCSEWQGRGSSVVISFHPHGKIKICGHPSHLRHLRAILPPRVFCGKSMLAPHSYFKKCSSTRFDYQVFALHFSFFFKKKSLKCLARIKIRLTFASAFRKEAVLKKRSLKDLDMNKQVVQD